MFVRATTIHADLSRLDEGVAFVRDRVVPAVDTLPGNLGLSMFVTRDPAIVPVATAWRTEQARRESDHLLTPLQAHDSRNLCGSACSGMPHLTCVNLCTHAHYRCRPPLTGS